MRRISNLTNEQKMYLGIISAVALIALPKLLLVALVGIERVLVGGILVVEQGIVTALRASASLLAVLGVAGLLFLTVSSFLKQK